MANLIKVLYKQKSFKPQVILKMLNRMNTHRYLYCTCVLLHIIGIPWISASNYMYCICHYVLYTVNIFYEVTEYYVVENNNNYNNEYFV